MVSDHGQFPIFETVRVNRVLADTGLVKTAEANGRTRVAADSPMVAITSGAAVHLYLNLEGREPGGVVREAEAAESSAARGARPGRPRGRGPAGGGEDLDPGRGCLGGLSIIRNSGDLVVFLAPGFAASATLDGPALEPSRYYGQHGFLAAHDEMCGMLFARGVGIKRTRMGEVSSTAVAPMVARWLGFELLQ